LPGFDRPSTNLPLFVIPYPLGFEIGPQTFRKTFAFRFTAVTRLACQSRSLRHKTIASLSGHPDCTMNLRPPSITVGLPPIVRRDLRHAVQVNRTSACLISALDSRRMVLSARTFRTTPSLNSCFRTEVRIQFRRSCHRQSTLSSRVFGRTTFD
jgi:hypothetical protein